MKEMPNDTEYTDTTIETVEGTAITGWSVRWTGGPCLWVPKESPIEPKPGMKMRLYSSNDVGLGDRVRGMVIDGVTVYYRSGQARPSVPAMSEEEAINEIRRVCERYWEGRGGLDLVRLAERVMCDHGQPCEIGDDCPCVYCEAKAALTKAKGGAA